MDQFLCSTFSVPIRSYCWTHHDSLALCDAVVAALVQPNVCWVHLSTPCASIVQVQDALQVWLCWLVTGIGHQVSSQAIHRQNLSMKASFGTKIHTKIVLEKHILTVWGVCPAERFKCNLFDRLWVLLGCDQDDQGFNVLVSTCSPDLQELFSSFLRFLALL